MKKTLPLIVLFITCSCAFSQVLNKKNYKLCAASEIINTEIPSLSLGNDAIWSFDFSSTDDIALIDYNDNGGWVNSDEGPQGQFSINIFPFESETSNNGFMLMDADGHNDPGDGSYTENMINSSFIVGPIDLSLASDENLVLEFNSYYRLFTGGDLNIGISTDGGETYSTIEYADANTYGVNNASPENLISQITLSSFFANTDSVFIEFNFTGTSHYFWMVDDLRIIERPAYDIQMKSSWLLAENPEGFEYHSTPKSQLAEEMFIGAEVYNYGFEDQTNVTLVTEVDNSYQADPFGHGDLESDSTAFIDGNYFSTSNLEIGSHNFSAAVYSTLADGEIIVDDNENDNSKTREFYITENEYQLDGWYENYTRLGTGMYGDDSNDGMKIGNYFQINNPTTLSSVRMGIFSTNSSPTIPGGEVIFYLCDTIGLSTETPSGNDMFDVIEESDYIMITQQDVDNGFVSVDFPDIELEPNGYMLIVEMFSNDGENSIYTLDDLTVVQPSIASMFYHPGDNEWYTNGNALSIHMGINGHSYVDINENEVLNNFNVYPNPTSSFINVSNNELLNKETMISIYNILGENIMNLNMRKFESLKTINIENLPNGNYIIKIDDGKNILYEKIVKE